MLPRSGGGLGACGILPEGLPVLQPTDGLKFSDLLISMSGTMASEALQFEEEVDEEENQIV